MLFDTTAFILALTMTIAGVIAVPVGGSVTFVVPMLLLLGFDAHAVLFMIAVAYYAVSLGSGGYLLKMHRLDWRVIALLSVTAIVGMTVATWFATRVSLVFLTPIVAWLVVLGGLLSVVRVKLWRPFVWQYPSWIVGVTNFCASFYSQLGGSGHNNLMALLMQMLYGWTLKNGLIHRRVASALIGWVSIVAFLYFGVRPTGYELALVVGGLVGGYLGGRVLDGIRETWLRWLFLVFAIAMAVKVSFFG